MVGDDDADTAAAEDSLRAELVGLPIDSIEQPLRLAPDGTRTVGLPELGVLLLTIANNAEIDVLWEEAQAKLEPLRATLNAALGQSWEEWQIPRDADPAWPPEARQAHAA